MTSLGAKSPWPSVSIVSLCETHVDCVNRTAPVVNEPTPFKMIRTFLLHISRTIFAEVLMVA